VPGALRQARTVTTTRHHPAAHPGDTAARALRCLGHAAIVALLWLGLTSQDATAQPTPCTPQHGRIQAGSVCLVAKVLASPEQPGRALALIVHGDGGAFLPPGYLASMERLAQRIARARPGDGVVFVQRPGYRSALGVSEGRAKTIDDDYTAENVAHMAAAARALRAHWDAKRVVWVGHSGGAALGALALGREPGVAEAAVLAGCPCGSVEQWRAHRNASRGRTSDSLWPNSLSPLEHMNGLQPGLRVVLLTGDRDENTLARFNEPWVAQARDRGVDAQMIILPGLDHGQVAGSAEVVSHTARLMADAP
jgi:pimeloyl-ACP methyl ester carboxylesterase